jgi:O-methyltransferase
MTQPHAKTATPTLSDDQFDAAISKAEEIIATACADSKRSYFHCNGLMTYNRNLSFGLDTKFMALATKHAALFDVPNWHWNLHVALWAAKQALHLPGDFIELGVFRGLTTGFVAEYLEWQKIDKKWYLFDLFGKFDQSQANESWGVTYYDQYDPATWEAQVRERFAPYANIIVTKGNVPSILHTAKTPDKIAFMHLDLNAAKAEIAALEVLFDRVVPGGVVLLDDYGWMAAHETQKMEMAWFADRGYMVMEIPTGQGLVIKR